MVGVWRKTKVLTIYLTNGSKEEFILGDNEIIVLDDKFIKICESGAITPVVLQFNLNTIAGFFIGDDYEEDKED